MTLVTIGSTAGASLYKPKSVKKEIKLHRVIAGGFFAMMISSVLVEADPKLGVGLAVLVAGGAFIAYGLPTLQESFTSQEKRKTK